MGCRDQLKKALLISSCLLFLCLASCTPKQDFLITQTKNWLKTEFGDSTVIQSLSFIPTEQTEIKYWRVSLVDEKGHRWEGLVSYSVLQKEFAKYQIPLPSQEEE